MAIQDAAAADQDMATRDAAGVPGGPGPAAAGAGGPGPVAAGCRVRCLRVCRVRWPRGLVCRVRWLGGLVWGVWWRGGGA